MIRSDSRRVLALAFIIVSVLSAAAAADEYGTIVLKSGDRYEDVLYKVNNYYKVVKVDYEGKEVNISFIDIESIHDRHGRDITKKILGSRYAAPGETWLTEGSQVIRRSREKIWNAALRLGTNYSIPSGDYYDGIVAGFGFGGTVHLPITHQIAIQVLVSKSGMKVDEDFRIYLNDPNYSIVSQDYGISTVRYLAAVEYYQHIDRSKTERSFWYIYSGLGAAVHKITTDAIIRYNPTGEQIHVDDSSNESKFIISLGFGFVKSVSRDIGIDFDVNMDIVHIGTVPSDTFGDDIVYAYIFDFKIGLMGFL